MFFKKYNKSILYEIKILDTKHIDKNRYKLNVFWKEPFFKRRIFIFSSYLFSTNIAVFFTELSVNKSHKCNLCIISHSNEYNRRDVTRK